MRANLSPRPIRRPPGTDPASTPEPLTSRPERARGLRLAARVAVVVLASTMLLWTELTPSGAAGPPRPSAYLYGDSLARESADYWEMLATDLGYEAKQSTYGGTAPCDFLRTFRKDMRRTTPRYVVVAFTGNNMTSCMADEAGEALVGDALYSTYRRDLNRYARIATRAGSTIVLVGPPESRGRDAGPMNEVYKTIADRYRGALYVYGGTYLTPRRQFRATAPCLSGETPDRGCGPDHRIKIRNPDGTHLCPEQPDGYSRSFSGCPVYAGGAMRYAETLVYELPPATCRLVCLDGRGNGR